MIKLYYREKTRATQARWILEELGLDYELHRVDIFAGDGQKKTYRQIHPLGQIPAIEIDGLVQFEAGAICHLLADRHIERGLAPALDSPQRVQYEQWFFYAVSSLDPQAALVVQHALLLAPEKRIADVVPWANQQYKRRLPALQTQLQDQDYLLGEKFSAADIMVGGILMWIPRALKDFPALKSYVKRLKARPAYQRATTLTSD